jgi:hypothetical protein
MIPNRANYGGKTRRTSKIHWQKGRSTVTGQLHAVPGFDEMVVLLSCAIGTEPRVGRCSLGVLSLLHDVALKRFTGSFCNTFAMCGARYRRCSEPCPLPTCNVCNTVNRRRR